jgi:hypothetical protein
MHTGRGDCAGIALKARLDELKGGLAVGADYVEVSKNKQLMFQWWAGGTPHALEASRLPRITGNLEYNTDIMSETTSPVTSTTSTPCACAGAAKAQPATAPAVQSPVQPAAAPAPAVPKAGKRSSRKR